MPGRLLIIESDRAFSSWINCSNRFLSVISLETPMTAIGLPVSSITGTSWVSNHKSPPGNGVEDSDDKGWPVASTFWSPYFCPSATAGGNNSLLVFPVTCSAVLPNWLAPSWLTYWTVSSLSMTKIISGEVSAKMR